MAEGLRVLIVTDDDDVAGTLAALLRRAGHPADSARGPEAPAVVADPPPDVLILDRDLPAARSQEILARLARHSGPPPVALLVMGAGSGAPPPLPAGWHEDAWMAISRPPHAGEILNAIAALRRLAFYRTYRALVHDLSQPVTAVHALARALAAAIPAGDPRSRTAVRLAGETERLMSLMQDFQRQRAASGP